jgi:hypothetical protein
MTGLADRTKSYDIGTNLKMDPLSCRVNIFATVDTITVSRAPEDLTFEAIGGAVGRGGCEDS